MLARVVLKATTNYGQSSEKKSAVLNLKNGFQIVVVAVWHRGDLALSPGLPDRSHPGKEGIGLVREGKEPAIIDTNTTHAFQAHSVIHVKPCHWLFVCLFVCLLVCLFACIIIIIIIIVILFLVLFLCRFPCDSVSPIESAWQKTWRKLVEAWAWKNVERLEYIVE